MKQAKNFLLLLLLGFVLSGLAWAFWYYTQQAGFYILGTLLVIGLLLDSYSKAKRTKQQRSHGS